MVCGERLEIGSQVETNKQTKNVSTQMAFKIPANERKKGRKRGTAFYIINCAFSSTQYTIIVHRARLHKSHKHKFGN